MLLCFSSIAAIQIFSWKRSQGRNGNVKIVNLLQDLQGEAIVYKQ